MTASVGPEVMARETARLIASDKVEGTPVRRSNGDKLGTIQRVMIDKRTGKVAYAVMTFGGFLGIRRVGAGNNRQSTGRFARRVRPVLPVYLARPRRRAASF